MEKIINQLRNQSESKRRYILHICTVVFAVILFIIWIYSLGQNFSDFDTQIKIKESLKPIDGLKANIIDGYKSL